MMDEYDYDTNTHGANSLRGCLQVVLIAGIVWACLIGAAFAQVAALQPGNAGAKIPLGQKGSTRITEAELRLPGVELLTIRTRRDFDPSVLAQCVATAKKTGDRWTWLPMGGDESNPLSATSLAAREKLYRDTGAKYGNDPNLYAVHACVPPYKHSEECFYGRPMPRAAIEAQKRIITVAAVAFPKAKIIWPGSANDPAANLEIIRYGVKAAPGRFVYKMNAMSPKPNLSWAGNTLLVDAAKAGADIGYEALQPSNHEKFGGTWAQFVAKVKEIERRAGKQFVYEAVYRYDLPKVGGLK
jgi:hypothetical protein